MKWMSIVPLIGGMSLGAERAIGNKPEAIISYPVFRSNDQLLLDYWNFNNYIVLDPDENQLPSNFDSNNTMIVNAVCPCAGLSTLNSSSTMGSNAPQNDWMYKSAEVVLEQIQPEIFMGENAPGLFTKVGEGVVSNLREIAKKNGYTFSMYKTCNSKHGVPQRRVRTFYFFWKGNRTPELPWIEMPYPKLTDFLNEIPEGATYNKKEPMIKKLENNFWWNFLKSEIESDTTKLRKIMLDSVPNRKVISILRYLFNKDDGPEKLYRNKELAINYSVKTGNDKMIPKIEHMVKKVEESGSYWDASPKVLSTDKTNAVISKNDFMNIHPIEDRFLTLREHMHLMKLPHDFQFPESENEVVKNINAIAQNVIVDSAEHVTHWAMDFLKNKLPLKSTDFLKQDNTHKKIEYEPNTIPLFS